LVHRTAQALSDGSPKMVALDWAPIALQAWPSGDQVISSWLTQAWLESHGISPLPWPSSSPDMNLIEHVWGYLDCKVHSQSVLPQNLNKLWKALEEEWYGINDLVLENLYASMLCRAEALYQAKGGSTQY
jgi:hypothetical protein